MKTKRGTKKQTKRISRYFLLLLPIIVVIVVMLLAVAGLNNRRKTNAKAETPPSECTQVRACENGQKVFIKPFNGALLFFISEKNCQDYNLSYNGGVDVENDILPFSTYDSLCEFFSSTEPESVSKDECADPKYQTITECDKPNVTKNCAWYECVKKCLKRGTPIAQVCNIGTQGQREVNQDAIDPSCKEVICANGEKAYTREEGVKQFLTGHIIPHYYYYLSTKDCISGKYFQFSLSNVPDKNMCNNLIKNPGVCEKITCNTGKIIYMKELSTGVSSFTQSLFGGGTAPFYYESKELCEEGRRINGQIYYKDRLCSK